jgi:hypothetical protein
MGRNAPRTRAKRGAITAPPPVRAISAEEVSVEGIRMLIVGALNAFDMGHLAGAVVVLTEASEACRKLWMRDGSAPKRD